MGHPGWQPAAPDIHGSLFDQKSLPQPIEPTVSFDSDLFMV
jgi:hypothetical protein